MFEAETGVEAEKGGGLGAVGAAPAGAGAGNGRTSACSYSRTSAS